MEVLYVSISLNMLSAVVCAGLVAQQQCCGPLQLPVADVAVMAQSHQGLTGAATSIGEQPLKGLVDPAAMARMALGEAVTNLIWAAATGLADVKASVNWMCTPCHSAPVNPSCSCHVVFTRAPCRC